VLMMKLGSLLAGAWCVVQGHAGLLRVEIFNSGLPRAMLGCHCTSTEDPGSCSHHKRRHESVYNACQLTPSAMRM
jgi:hypothetical protein